MIARRIIVSTSVIALIGASFSLDAQAEKQKSSGSVTYVPVWSKKSDLPDGTSAQRDYFKGIVLAGDMRVPFHLSTQDCFGTTILTADGMPLVSNGYCDAVDKDGDVWWIWWHNSTDENTWGFMGGTGKYEGIKGGGTTRQEQPAADGRFMIWWEGSWEMK